MFRKKTILTTDLFATNRADKRGLRPFDPEPSAPSDDFIATSVAATVNAQPAETAEPATTEFDRPCRPHPPPLPPNPRPCHHLRRLIPSVLLLSLLTGMPIFRTRPWLPRSR